ncbi:MAG: type II toxin-antitoxin system YafQ family toxin [bacterium]|nr:type II toxin-antitoxin system YafQ family toxin [bacterium]
MKFYLTTDLVKELNSLRVKNPKLFRKIQKQLKFFRQNHLHPSLRNHKLKGGLAERWSISIEENLRMLYYLRKDEAIFFDLGTHDEVYRKR